jgi:hypothetical protein
MTLDTGYKVRVLFVCGFLNLLRPAKGPYYPQLNTSSGIYIGQESYFKKYMFNK